jgi:hypothetical protein
MNLLQAVSVVVGFAAAAAWLTAALWPVPSKFHQGWFRTPEFDDLARALQLQGRINALAALLTGVASLLQALAAMQAR